MCSGVQNVLLRLEGDLIKINKKFEYTDRTVAHLETVSENAGKKVHFQKLISCPMGNKSTHTGDN